MANASSSKPGTYKYPLIFHVEVRGAGLASFPVKQLRDEEVEWARGGGEVYLAFTFG